MALSPPLNDPDLRLIAGGLEAIIDAAADVLAQTSLETTLMRMADALAGIVPYTSLAVYELDEPARRLVPMIAVGSFVEETLADCPPLDDSLTGKAVKAGVGVLSIGSDDLSRHEHTVPGTPQEEDEALVVAPLFVAGKPIGTLNVWREQAGATFNGAEERLLQRFATLAAMAYVNARQADVLREQARRDPLTGVFNRRHFELELGEAIERAGLAGAIVLFDVDEFKPINDRFGHPAGDLVLKALAAALAETAGDDGAVYRIGGDEFAVLLPGMSRAEADDWTSRACAAVERLAPAIDTRVRTSAGVAQLRPNDTVETVVRRADNSLLDAKRSSRRNSCRG